MYWRHQGVQLTPDNASTRGCTVVDQESNQRRPCQAEGMSQSISQTAASALVQPFGEISLQRGVFVYIYIYICSSLFYLSVIAPLGGLSSPQRRRSALFLIALFQIRPGHRLAPCVGSLSSLIGSILFRIFMINHEYCLAGPGPGQSRYLAIPNGPVVIFAKALPAFVNTSGLPACNQLSPSPWSVPSVIRRKQTDPRLDVNSYPSPEFSPFRPIILA